MLVATWNVNSVRARLPRLLPWLAEHSPDVVALQETKCTTEQFPAAEVEALGYSVAQHASGRWNGVALLSRVGLADVTLGFDGAPGWGDPPEIEARVVAATCGGVRLWSVYVPNGRSPEDPHYLYKLAWLARLRDAAAAEAAATPELPIALCGDFNIAPTDDDVWDPAVFATSTHVTPPERAAFGALVEAGFADVVKPFAPAFTYWDYTQLRFPRKEGMRIDFVLGSPPFAARVTGAAVDRAARKGKGPSDHAPVLVTLSD
ncbi:MAG: exodeoxyribonuclease III [Pseudonocardia sp.]|nr:exodeoxyribonuclease III [Pseudonocardia sp.]